MILSLSKKKKKLKKKTNTNFKSTKTEFPSRESIFFFVITQQFRHLNYYIYLKEEINFIVNQHNSTIFQLFINLFYFHNKLFFTQLI